MLKVYVAGPYTKGDGLEVDTANKIGLPIFYRTERKTHPPL